MVVTIGVFYMALFINPSEALSQLYRGRLLQRKDYFAVCYIILHRFRLCKIIYDYLYIIPDVCEVSGLLYRVLQFSAQFRPISREKADDEKSSNDGFSDLVFS